MGKHLFNVLHELRTEFEIAELFAVIIEKLLGGAAVYVHPPITDKDCLIEKRSVGTEERLEAIGGACSAHPKRLTIRLEISIVACNNAKERVLGEY